MYIPKSQITPNLYTEGNELYLVTTNQPYTGYYHALSDGSFYTGRTPQASSKIRLIPPPNPFVKPGEDPTTDTLSYVTTAGEEEAYAGDFLPTKYPLYTYNISSLPYYSPTVPTDKDYQAGEFKRFFCKKVNELTYLEINKETYDSIFNKNPKVFFQYFIAFNIPWLLTGDKEQVYKVNKNMVDLAIRKQMLYMFDKYIQNDYLKYYKNTA